MTHITVVGARVLVEPMAAEAVSSGGIYIPESAQEKSQQGVVRGVGDGQTDDGTVIVIGLNIGNRVLFSKYSGTEIELDGKKHIVLNYKDILAILSE